MTGRDIARLGAGIRDIGGEPQQVSYLVQGEAELAGPADKDQALYVFARVDAVAARRAFRLRDEADPLVIADRLDVAAGAPRRFADADLVSSHGSKLGA